MSDAVLTTEREWMPDMYAKAAMCAGALKTEKDSKAQ